MIGINNMNSVLEAAVDWWNVYSLFRFSAV